MKQVILALLVVFSAPSIAAPTKAEAEQWYEEFRAAKDKVFDGLFIEKTNEHMVLTKQIIDLNRQAEKLFGEPLTSPLANCTSSAIGLQAIWSEIADLARTGNLEQRKPAYIASMSWRSGEKYPTCLAEIEKLK